MPELPTAQPIMDEAAPAGAGAAPLASAYVEAFIARRTEDWARLEALLARAELHGARGLTLAEVRALGRLYRAACADLLVARDELGDARLSAFLDPLVARGYACVYAREAPSGRRTLTFLARDFPALVRRERRLIALSAALILLGACFGASVVATDPSALSVVLPDMHLDQTPNERVQGERHTGGPDAGSSAAFSSFLFTHNIQVTFLLFALGVTFGLGTAAVLFWNGIPLGALAVQYQASGEGLFFWAWILPHGVLELTVVTIAGAAGFVLARGLWFPQAYTRAASLAREAPAALGLVLGGMPLLVLAGVIEGTLSQMHAPGMPAWIKLSFAGAALCLLVAYLRRPSRPERASEAP
jgi:uncharacterized membrane protein SpoIIM required for sporulation